MHPATAELFKYVNDGCRRGSTRFRSPFLFMRNGVRRIRSLWSAAISCPAEGMLVHFFLSFPNISLYWPPVTVGIYSPLLKNSLSEALLSRRGNSFLCGSVNRSGSGLLLGTNLPWETLRGHCDQVPICRDSVAQCQKKKNPSNHLLYLVSVEASIQKWARTFADKWARGSGYRKNGEKFNIGLLHNATPIAMIEWWLKISNVSI